MKKGFAFILASILMITCIAGCSSGSSSNSPSPSVSPSKSVSSGSDSSGSSSGGASPSDDAKKGNITASGSTALQPLLTQAVDPFKSDKEFSGAVTINGGGSAQGLADLASGAVDIALSDVSPEQLGIDGTEFVDHQVGIVAVGIVVSPDVAANLTDNTISAVDLKGIYAGTITDWKQVAGWKGASIAVAAYYQKSGSGMRTIFETYGINAPLSDEQLKSRQNFIEIQSSASFKKAFESGIGAIGYTALPYCSKLTVLKVDGIEPTYENIYSGKYKMWSCEHLYTKGEPLGAVKAFIEYVTSSDFEKTVTENGYGLISEMKVSR